MKKKFLTILLAVCAVIACAFGFSACNSGGGNDGDDGGHEHTYSDKWTSAGADGHYHKATCEHTDEHTELVAHTFDSGVITTPATCTTDGVKTFTCTATGCGYTKTEPISAAHTPAPAVKENEVAPTCVNTGSYDEVVYCSECGTELTRIPKTVENDPTAHVWSQDWDKDETHHWHNCTVEGCTETDNSKKDGYDVHEFINGDCVCGQTLLRFSLNSDNQSYRITSIRNVTVTSIEIPKEYNGLAVTDIEPLAFYYCKSIERINYTGDIASWCGIVHIYNLMLYGKSTKTLYIDGQEIADELVIPNNVTSIPSDAFNGCSKLTSITISDSVTSIDFGAFRACTGLTSITISDSVTSIGAYAFDGCSSLESITVDENNLNYVSQDGILYDKGKTDFVYVPKAIKGAVVIPNSITSFSRSAFEDCSGLTSITIPNSVTSFGDWAFSGCSGLTSITIPNSVTSIGYGAFDGCSIETATIPAMAINYIKNSALKTVVVTSGESISSNAFSGCSSLESITLPFVGASKDGTSNTHFGYIFGASSYSNNSNYVPTSLKTVVITGGESIGYSAFRGCYSLESITLPFVGASKDGTSNTHFGYIFGASSHSYNSTHVPLTLKTVVITGGESIGDYAFENCSRLTSVTIGNGVTRIGYSAFQGCSSLTSVTIPDSVTDIDTRAFSVGGSLESIYYTGDIAGWCGIKNGLRNLDKSKVYIGNQKLQDMTEIVIPESVTSIGGYAFSGCSSLTSITIPDSVTSIGGYAFSGCSSLTSITIPDGVTSIGWNVFSGCGLTSVTFENTDGWKVLNVNGSITVSSSSLSSTSTAATYLTYTYSQYDWERG